MADKIGSKDRDGSGGEWNAREIARRNLDHDGRPLSPVMKAAATACELAHSQAARRPRK
jgi:hypothetical protein